MVVAVVSLLTEGGSGKQGSVVSVNDAPDDQSYRSWVKVKWDAGGTNDYRRGYEGLLDVKCSTAAKGELYYVAHLPKLGNNNNNNNNNIRDNVYGAVIMAEPLREFTRFI